MTDGPTPPAPAATPVFDDAMSETFLAAIEDVLDLDEREVMALRAREAALRAYAAGTLPREDAVEALVALGDAGLPPPRPPEHVIEEQTATFEALWRAEVPTPRPTAPPRPCPSSPPCCGRSRASPPPTGTTRITSA